MAQPTPDTLNADQHDFSLLENLIQTGNVTEARRLLRHILFALAGVDGAGETIGDALTTLAGQKAKKPLAAILLLRCLAVQNLIPEPNAINQIIRSIVEICEHALPEVISFLKIDKRAQNYEKFPILCGFHDRVMILLDPLRLPYGDLDALLHASHEINGCLNHSIVRVYTGPYNLKEVRTTIKSLIGKLRKVCSESTTLLLDLEECNRLIASTKTDLIPEDSFLVRDALFPFLDTCETNLSQFLDSRRGRFTTTVSLETRELQKRYPLHELGRNIQIAVPLRNSGPGMATDLRISAVAEGEHVVFSQETVVLGNVQPGIFSVALDATVKAACEGFVGLLQAEWGEIGAPARKSEAFEFKVVAQASSIDWNALEYRSPYNTGVAEGENFIGRTDKVRSLAAKLLRSPMKSFFITGQKRVGKTSLALAVAEFANTNTPNNLLEFHYVLWGSIAHADPSVAMENLGRSIEEFITGALPRGVEVPESDYRGSLADLIRIASLALRIHPERRFVVILDEFDEIPPELFLYGNLAETFFGNLRALSRCKNVCIVLVGGENMPFIMERQGQKLNNFSQSQPQLLREGQRMGGLPTSHKNSNPRHRKLA